MKREEINQAVEQLFEDEGIYYDFTLTNKFVDLFIELSVKLDSELSVHKESFEQGYLAGVREATSRM